jgi:uncharacterized cupin superfamily protein
MKTILNTMQRTWRPAAVASLSLIMNIARSNETSVVAPQRVTKVSPAELGTSPRVAVPDDQWMTVTAGKGGKVANVASFVTTDKRFQVDVSAYDHLTLELKDWPVDEFMYFLEGSVEITDAQGNRRMVKPGDAIVMPRGFHGTWRQLGPIKKIAVSYWASRGPGASPAIVSVDRKVLRSAPMQPIWGDTGFAHLIDAAGAQYVEVPAYDSVDHQLSIAAKKYDRITLEMKGWSTDEFILVLAGGVEIVDVTGRVERFASGQAFVIPRGFVGIWRQLGQIEMLTVNYGPST